MFPFHCSVNWMQIFYLICFLPIRDKDYVNEKPNTHSIEKNRLQGFREHYLGVFCFVSSWGLLLCLEYCPKTLFVIMMRPFEGTQETSVQSMSHTLSSKAQQGKLRHTQRNQGRKKTKREQILSVFRSYIGLAEWMVQSWDTETKKEKRKEEKEREGY